MNEAARACLADCTEAQQEAIRHMDGPLLVLAGPGSGKTRVITRRVGHLIASGVDPRSILAITFTNKAADEMRSRVQRLGLGGGVWVATFHSTCARVLRQHADLLGYTPQFSIFDTADALAVVKQAIREVGLDPSEHRPSAVAQRISAAKNAFRTPEEAAAGSFGFVAEARVHEAYARLMRRQNAMDFDDLLLRMVELLRDHDDVRRRLQDRFRYLLVDEYQDTNRTQYLIARYLAEKHRNLCATGDPDQSIYAWRGADINNILDFEQDYPDARVVRLEQNYRSTRVILRAASSLISRNVRRKAKDLWTENPEGAPIRVGVCDDENDEGVWVAGNVRQAIAEGVDPAEVAVFYRTNAQSRSVETALRLAGIPYMVVQGVEFYQRREIKDLLAYLRLLVNPDDAVSLERIANVPARGLGGVSLARLRTAADQAGVSVLKAMGSPEQAGLRGAGAQAAKALAALIAGLHPVAQGSAAEALRRTIQQVGYREYLEGQEYAEDRVANVEELVSAAASYDQENPEGGVLGFLERSALVSDADGLKQDARKVSLMTLHCAKGLEFDVVCIVGVEDGLLPLTRQGEIEDTEEERRLFFVGATRARKRLYLSHAAQRTRYGRTQYMEPSRFLSEMPEETMDHGGALAASPAMPEPAFRHRKRASGAYAAAPFRTGDMVEHPKFGLGRVLGLAGFGEMQSAVVNFSSVGVKVLALKYAGMAKAGRKSPGT